MIKRIIITQYPAYTGVGKYVHDLMQIKGFKDAVYTLYFKKDDAAREYYGEMILGGIQFPHSTGWFLNSAFQSVAFRSWRKKINNLNHEKDIIFHYTDFGIKPISPSEKSILTLHDFFLVSEKYRHYGYKAQPFLKSNVKKFMNFEHVIADTKHVAKEALEYGFEYEPTVIYPPAGAYISSVLDKVECRRKHNLPLDKKLLLSISSSDPRKNLPAITDTMGYLNDQYKLVRVGTPMKNAYNFKNLTNQEINELYNACDVFLFPTLDEGLGFPLIEAMSAGIPIVSSDIEAVQEICGDASILVEPTGRSLSLAVKEAISQTEQLFLKGKERSALFSQENFESQIKDVYSHL